MCIFKQDKDFASAPPTGISVYDIDIFRTFKLIPVEACLLFYSTFVLLDHWQYNVFLFPWKDKPIVIGKAVFLFLN